ncbi:MAG: hypothetical protein WCO94_04400 [Verrucomicrobiota bacterium]
MKFRRDFWFFLPLALTPALLAAIKPNAMFADHVVLQRERPVPIWGTADLADKITVTFANQTTKTHSNTRPI